MEDDNEVGYYPIYESEGVTVWKSWKATDSQNHIDEQAERHAREAACLGKIKYPTPEACRTVLTLFRGSRRSSMDCYQCHFCGSYHLTSKLGDGSLD